MRLSVSESQTGGFGEKNPRILKEFQPRFVHLAVLTSTALSHLYSNRKPATRTEAIIVTVTVKC